MVSPKIRVYVATVKATTSLYPLGHGYFVQVSIRYFTVLRELTGKKEEKLIFPENQKTTINAVLKMLSEKYNKSFIDYVFDPDGQVKGFLQFLINGTSATTLQGLETTLQEGDVLAILPPIGGG
ncbi:MAG: MoaD/ThiS family protein [Candidatus Bathyarchaeia archaeon]|jgi:molybdopterin synthase sulfur carrier subunit